MAPQEALQRLVQGKAGVDGARPRQHEDEARQQPPAAADRQGAEVAPVDLGLLAGERLQAQVRFGARGRPHRAYPAPDLDRGAREAALADHRVQPRGAQARVLLQGGEENGLVGIERARADLRARTDEALDGHPDRVVMHAERGGDGADAPVLGVIESADLRALLGRDHARASAPPRGAWAHVHQRGMPHKAARATAARASRAGDGTSDLGIVNLLLAARGVEERRRHDAARGDRWGSLMRHFLRAGAIPGLARGVVEPAPATVLIPPSGGPPRGLPRPLRTGFGAVAVAAIAAATQEKDAPAVAARADDKPKRVQAPPRSGGRGLDTYAVICDHGGAESRPHW